LRSPDPKLTFSVLVRGCRQLGQGKQLQALK